MRLKAATFRYFLYISVGTCALVAVWDAVYTRSSSTLEAFTGEQYLKLNPWESRADVLCQGPTSLSKAHLASLSQALFLSIGRVQNPGNCRGAKKFICDLSSLQSRDFGLLLHTIVACHLISYGSGRVLIVRENSSLPFITHLAKLKNFLSDECLQDAATASYMDMKATEAWENMLYLKKDVPVIQYKVGEDDISGPHPAFVAGTMPSSLRRSLYGLHSEPDAWFIGHFVLYYFANNQWDYDKALKILMSKFGDAPPAVGLYLQTESGKNGLRYSSASDFVDDLLSDKGFRPSTYGVLVKTGMSREGSVSVPETEFMEEADAHFSRSCNEVKNRQVFLATDDHGLREYFMETYGQRYNFCEIPLSIKSPGQVPQEYYNGRPLQRLIAEIDVLVSSDFVVCKFSSHICRLVYELKLATSSCDVSSSVVSLDYQWGFDYPGYRWSRDLSIRVMATRSGRFVDDSSVSYLKGEVLDLFGWYSFNETRAEDVLGVRQRNIKHPKVGKVSAKDMHVFVNVNNDPIYLENSFLV